MPCMHGEVWHRILTREPPGAIVRRCHTLPLSSLPSIVAATLDMTAGSIKGANITDIVNRWAVDSDLWETPGMDAERRKELEKQNLGSLKRKITYCLKRPDEKVQFQRVEGWTTGEILAHMKARGISQERIDKSLHRTTDR